MHEFAPSGRSVVSAAHFSAQCCGNLCCSETANRGGSIRLKVPPTMELAFGEREWHIAMKGVQFLFVKCYHTRWRHTEQLTAVEPFENSIFNHTYRAPKSDYFGVWELCIYCSCLHNWQAMPLSAYTAIISQNSGQSLLCTLYFILLSCDTSSHYSHWPALPQLFS